jgi:hypothetical protein
MKSEDPEARIRELEQPLAEAARASEATANQSPSIVIGMICLPLVISHIRGCTADSAGGRSLSVAGINESRTEECKDREVRLSGVGNQVVLTGHCASLSISGVRNKVIVDATESIEASGFNNDITYLIGTPHIDTSGTGNLVHKGCALRGEKTVEADQADHDNRGAQRIR